MNKITPRRSVATGDLPDALRRWCENEWLTARYIAKWKPAHVTPPGTTGDDWRLYLSRGALPLMEAAMRANIWEVPE